VENVRTERAGARTLASDPVEFRWRCSSCGMPGKAVKTIRFHHVGVVRGEYIGSRRHVREWRNCTNRVYPRSGGYVDFVAWASGSGPAGITHPQPAPESVMRTFGREHAGVPQRSLGRIRFIRQTLSGLMPAAETQSSIGCLQNRPFCVIESLKVPQMP
jgi:hypothetical protein